MRLFQVCDNDLQPLLLVCWLRILGPVTDWVKYMALHWTDASPRHITAVYASPGTSTGTNVRRHAKVCNAAEVVNVPGKSEMGRREVRALPVGAYACGQKEE